MADLSKLPVQLDVKKRTCRAIIETPKAAATSLIMIRIQARSCWAVYCPKG